MTTVAQIRLNLTPGEFDLIRSTLEVAANENKLASTDRGNSPKENSERRILSSQQFDLLRKMNAGS